MVAIAKHSGKSISESSVEHRFRPIKKAAQVIRAAVAEGADPEELDLGNMTEKGRGVFSSAFPGLPRTNMLDLCFSFPSSASRLYENFLQLDN